jgi:hypothetical protein
MNIPARYCTDYLGDIGVAVDYGVLGINLKCASSP